MHSTSPTSFSYTLEQVERINRTHWLFVMLGGIVLVYAYFGQPELPTVLFVPLGSAASAIVFGLLYENVRTSNAGVGVKRRRLTRCFALQITLDLILAGLAIHVTGGPLSPLPIVYIIFLGLLAVSIPARQLIIVNATAAVLYAVMIEGYALGLWKPVTPLMMRGISLPPGFAFGLDLLYLAGMILNGLLLFGGARDLQNTWRGIDEQRNFLDGLNDLTRLGLGQTDLKRLYQLVANHLGMILGADNAYILVGDDERKSHSAEIYGPIAKNGGTALGDEGARLAGHIRQAGSYLVIEDVRHSPYIPPGAIERFPAQAILGLPMFGFSDRRFLGAALITYRSPHVFRAEEIERAQQAAGVASLLLSRMRLYEETLHRAELLQELSAQVTDLTSDLKRTTLLPAIVEAARNLLKAQRAALYLYDKSSRKTSCEYSVGLSENFVEQMNSRFSGIPGGAVIQDQQYVLIPDIHQDSRTSPVLGLFMDEGFQAYGMFMLPSPAGSLGALGVYWNQPHAISSEEVSAARMFAARAGGILHNASLYAQASEEAVTDAITGLPNRRHLDKRLQEEGLQHSANRHPFTLIMIDLDGFKTVNDTFGHPIGDSVLQQVALILRRAVRSTDFIARYGGDEFAVVLPETDIGEAMLVADKLHTTLTRSRIHLPMETQQYLSASMGLASYPNDNEDLSELIKIADNRLYKAKHVGDGTIIFDG